MAYVTIKTYFDPAEAELIRSRLEAAGFTVYVAHEVSEINTIGYSMAGEGIAVQVPEEEANDALALLQSEEHPSGNSGSQSQSEE